MQKAKKYNIADSNIANLGSDLEKKVKLDAAKTEKAWEGAGKAVGLQIWRVENFHIVPVDKASYGKFYSGDSYIILRTYKKTPDSPALAFDVHFWLGTYTTQDEAGTAAYKTVELDDYLGGAPVQYREVQSFESNQFMSNFPAGIRIQDGGAASGFKHVKPADYRPRLLHVKQGTKKSVRMLEVPLEINSLNSGDVFILDLGTEVIQWNGSGAGPFEKSSAAATLQAIESERGGKSKGRVVQESEDDAVFWKSFGGKKPVKSAAEGGSDVAPTRNPTNVLYKLSDDSGKLEFTKVGEAPKLDKKLLNSDDVFLVDNGEAIYTWVGKKASAEEKKNALGFAQTYLTEHNKPVYTPIVRVLEGGENNLFNLNFA